MISKTVEVTPLAGVWIEIQRFPVTLPVFSVTPLAGVWIEIEREKYIFSEKESLPSRECGLKWRC